MPGRDKEKRKEKPRSDSSASATTPAYSSSLANTATQVGTLLQNLYKQRVTDSMLWALQQAKQNLSEENAYVLGQVIKYCLSKELLSNAANQTSKVALIYNAACMMYNLSANGRAHSALTFLALNAPANLNKEAIIKFIDENLPRPKSMEAKTFESIAMEMIAAGSKEVLAQGLSVASTAASVGYSVLSSVASWALSDSAVTEVKKITPSKRG